MKRILLCCSLVIAASLHLPCVSAQTLHIFSPTSTSDQQSLDEQTSDDLTVKLFADGNTKTILTGENQQADETTTNGSIGLLFEWGNPSSVLSGLVNVAAAEDTLVAGFGQSLLAPGTGNLGGIVELHLPFPGTLLGTSPGALAIHLYSSVSSNTWKHEDDAADIVVFGGGALLAYDLGIEKQDAFYGLRVEGGLTYRGLYGDAASNGSFREEALGTEVRRFLGLEAGISLTARNLTAGITFYRFSDSSDKSIPGFSGGQLAGGISISTAIPLTD